ncbi:hypothetical protein V1514DRAFT_326103 [Lipomyces japonicus]|uniref:uncharacterized protein n=1 Tax=Lipomyces japonicus TaxID=56871 RepID=UPI0034CF6D93
MSFFKRRGGTASSSQQQSTAASSSSSFSTTTSSKNHRDANAATATFGGRNNVRSLKTQTGSSESTSSIPTLAEGSDRYFGFENFGYTCYCNSVLQCLYYSKPFRDAVISYPPSNSQKSRPRRTSVHGVNMHPFLAALKNQAEREAIEAATLAAATDIRKKSAKAKRSSFLLSSSSSSSSAANTQSSTAITTPSSSQVASSTALASQPQQTLPTAATSTVNANGIVTFANGKPLFGDESSTPEQKKKAALVNGPILNMDHSINQYYDMNESMFSTLKDVFEAMLESGSPTGIVSPAKLIEVLKRQNELFRSSMHQDAHEFFNFLLNEIVDNVESHERVLAKANPAAAHSGKWVHELFEGLLTSETKCLTCENVSRRDEQFLDLSIDLERHSSVTSCLRQFSASEMLCESNKFHCDCCGGLQEAEKRMKIKRLPQILALHLKRFKFTEDMQRNVKLFHKVVFPYHLRLFNTTDDVQDPDRLYELYAVVVHIGGGPYHGHYVSIVKTEHAGWVLFDDELVERVDENYVTNFFGDKPGLACAYILFYQEISNDEYEQQRRNSSHQTAPGSTVVGQDQTSLQTKQASTPSPITISSIIDSSATRNSSSITSPPVPAPARPSIPQQGTLVPAPSNLASSLTTLTTASASGSSLPSSSSASSTASIVPPSLPVEKQSSSLLLPDVSVTPAAATTISKQTPSSIRTVPLSSSPNATFTSSSLSSSSSSPPAPAPSSLSSSPSLLSSSQSPSVVRKQSSTQLQDTLTGQIKSKKEGNGGGVSRLKSTSFSSKQKFWKRDGSSNLNSVLSGVAGRKK